MAVIEMVASSMYPQGEHKMFGGRSRIGAFGISGSGPISAVTHLSQSVLALHTFQCVHIDN